MYFIAFYEGSLLQAFIERPNLKSNREIWPEQIRYNVDRITKYIQVKWFIIQKWMFWTKWMIPNFIYTVKSGELAGDVLSIKILYPHNHSLLRSGKSWCQKSDQTNFSPFQTNFRGNFWVSSNSLKWLKWSLIQQYKIFSFLAKISCTLF